VKILLIKKNLGLKFLENHSENQSMTAYGEAKINLLEITNKTARITAYGEAEVSLNTSDIIKISAFGNAQVFYKGSPEIDKGLVIGNSKIQQLN